MKRTIPLGRTRLEYHEIGEPSTATPAVLLHPWFGCHQMWAPTAARLRRRCLAVDWYSLSSGDWREWASPQGLTAALEQLVDGVGLTHFDLVGNSVGGIVAQLFAARHPGRVRRLVLVGTGASLSGPPTAFGALVSRWLTEPDQRPALTRALVDALVAQPLDPAGRDEYVAMVQQADPDFVAAVLGAARGLDLRPMLGAITAPTLVVRGEHDTARTRDHVADLLDGIAVSTAVEMAGCGHSPMIEDVDEFTGLLQRHLDDGDSAEKSRP